MKTILKIIWEALGFVLFVGLVAMNILGALMVLDWIQAVTMGPGV